ncbi:MAG: nucleotidyltransferase domain-containing protein [Caldilineaceae bacterium]
MKNIAHTKTVDWPLDRVIAILRTQDQVEGLLIIGSLAEKTFTPASDYDLVIILKEGEQAWYVGVTQIDGHFTDLIFVATSALEQILELNAPVAQDHKLAPMIPWLQQGNILFDRSQRIQQAQTKLRSGTWVQPLNDTDAYGAWFAINYNLAQAKRMAQARDDLYQTTVGIRMAVYGHTDIWFGYFTIRKLAWRGDKEAVKYLMQFDPTFLTVYQQLINETALAPKLLLYEKAAALATAPLGGLWTENTTVMNIEQAIQTWQTLMGSTL